LSRLLNCNTDVEERTERGRTFYVLWRKKRLSVKKN